MKVIKANPENICNHLVPEKYDELDKSDSLKIMFEMQTAFQDRVGKLKEYKNSDMFQKCQEAIYNMYCIQDEFSELLGRVPWKKWKFYSPELKRDWFNKEQRDETLMEYIDMFHFFMNIGIIFGFTADEIFAAYKEKNKENFDRQDRGY